MPTYRYICSNTDCNKTYMEHRDIDDSQFITHCVLCGMQYTEVTE